MQRISSTLWRFLIPVLLLLGVAPFLLVGQQTAQHLRNVRSNAQGQAYALARLLQVTDTLIGEQTRAEMHLLRQRCDALGTPEIAGSMLLQGQSVPKLQLGPDSGNDMMPIVDEVTRLLGGTATLFVKSGNDFVRVATTIRQSDGSRAVGTRLDQRGKAILELRRGRPFQGQVDILGEPYITRYEPMFNAAGEIIGAYYVGYKVDTQVLRDAVENTRILDSGFAAVVDQNQQIRFHSAHLRLEQASEVLRQPGRTWQLVEESVAHWGFKVIVAYPLAEARWSGANNALLVVGVAGVLGLMLVGVILWQLRRLVLDPIGGDPALAIDVVQRIADGDLERDGLTAKPGTLMAHVLNMRRKLSESMLVLRHQAERMSLSSRVLEHAHDGILITDEAARIIEVNPAFVSFTGYTREEVMGRTPHEIGFAMHDAEFFQRNWLNPGSSGEWRGECWNQRKNGEIYPAWIDLFVVHRDNQSVANFVCVFSDITSAKEQQQSLEHMAYHDPLTQLPNRTLLADRLQQAMARAARGSQLLGVCYFDLDGFKPVNDTMGHEAGDRLLVQLASRLKTCLRDSDTIARLGGDEFAILLCDITSVQQCNSILDRLLEAINAPFLLNQQTVRVSASMGYTLYPMDDAEPDTLLRHADHAMYQAKISGGGRYHLFDAEHDRQTRGKRQERERIEQALQNQELRLFYQPKVNIRRGSVVGMEALIRWQHPELGLRNPGDFLPAVEDTDFIIPIGEWVIGAALRQISAWRSAGLEMHVSVNIAARHMIRPDFALRLAGLLQQQPDVPPHLLELEITETAAIEDVAGVAQVISSCKLLGVTFALDDFGVGYSSLTYLRRLPVEVIKVDQSFVRDMLHDNEDKAMVAGVVSLAREFHRQVIAEGVETAEHGVQLLRMGCELAQGYGIARPMPADQVPEWVARYRPDPAWSASP